MGIGMGVATVQKWDPQKKPKMMVSGEDWAC